MKKYKRIILLFNIIYILINVNSFQSKAVNTKDDVYDVVLFWGQSNMVGTAGIYPEERKQDTRYDYNDENSVKQYANYTGINQTYLKNSKAVNYVEIGPEDNTAFEYVYSTNSLKKITKDTKKLGEYLLYNSDTKKLEKTTIDKVFSIQSSYGTNMIPEFCRQYYNRTGHKVVAVFAGHGGRKIENFLPTTDVKCENTNNEYLYNAITTKYKAAINYLEKNNYKIGNKLYVVCQGEYNARNGTTQANYQQYFKTVHNSLKRDLKITKGAIVETSRTIGTYYEGVEKIHKAQENLIKNNSDIILGSSYAYTHYIPDKANYEKSTYKNNKYLDSNGEKLPYSTAYEYASYSMCNVSAKNNMIHFTSAALAQMGYETARGFSKTIDYKVPTISALSLNTKEWTKGNVTLTVKATDSGSGLAEKAYSWDGKKTWGITTTKTVSANGTYTVYVKDKLGNIASKSIKISNIDKTAPTIGALSLNTKEWTKGNVTLTVKATDSGSGLAEKAYSWDGKKTWGITTTKTVSANGTYTVYVKDKAGNITSKSIDIKNIDKTIDNEKPVEKIKRGDINADKKIDITDLLWLKRHIVSESKALWILTGDKLKAADINKDGKVDITDLLLLKRHIVAGNKEEWKIK